MRPAALPTPAAASPVEPADAARFAADVRYYMMQQPRQLPSRYLYDALGSALFDAICRLPWYTITRAEQRLLAQHAAEILRRVAPSTIVELGSGSGEKLRVLVDARGDADRLDVHLVDISPAALESSGRALRAFAGVRVTPHRGAYEDGLREIAAALDRAGRVLVLFLGSNIGNYDPPGANAFLRGVRGALRGGDALLLGADLRKPPRALQLAYDDPLGVTAAFNRNLLVRINRELGGDFDLDRFGHDAVWNADASRIEMHLVARRPQEIHVPAADLTFAMRAGERIWTESSYKYDPSDVVHLLESAGFGIAMQWVDADDRFALTLVEAM